MSHFSPSQKSSFLTCLLFESRGGGITREKIDGEKEEWFYFCESSLDYGKPSDATLELGCKAKRDKCCRIRVITFYSVSHGLKH